MYIADLHIHSHYARATSRECVPEYLDLWARRKGISLVGTGDWTHALWRKELREKLTPCGDGFYTLREEYRLHDDATPEDAHPRFAVTGEISTIYKKNGRTRKVHHVIVLPSLEAADQLSARLERIGNIHSDGRPILGLDSRDLCALTFDTCAQAIYIPAHIWTPHFSLFGAFSGFDTIEECFGDMTPHIHALETGLSSDPPMNWRLSALDRYTLVSNSDAHSPAKLGREANLLDGDMHYDNLVRALSGEAPSLFRGTIEFFPEEGKYHYDGHRACGVCLSPREALEHQNLCPVCKKRMTIGVSHRVEALSDRPDGFVPDHAPGFENLVPLPEIIAAALGVGAVSAKVTQAYLSLLRALGPEFSILRTASISDIQSAGGELIAEGVKRMREGRIVMHPGFDGEFGHLEVFTPDELLTLKSQLSFLPVRTLEKRQKPTAPVIMPKIPMAKETAPRTADTLNARQTQAVQALAPAVAVIAGPGTGKTKTLVSRVAYLIAEKGAHPEQISAVTFTNKAAQEMRERLSAILGKRVAAKVTIGTFHSLCLHLLRGWGVQAMLVDSTQARAFAAHVIDMQSLRTSPRALLEAVSRRKNGQKEALSDAAFDAYDALLAHNNLLDFDDLLLQVIGWIDADPSVDLRAFAYVHVDEFQDINPLQFALLKRLWQHSVSRFCIGDPDQAIYGFRGADANCFALLAADFPELLTVRLDTNYRCTPQILSCANALIGHNPAPAPRELHAALPSGTPVRLVHTPDEFVQGIYIAKEIARLAGGIDMHTAAQRERVYSFSDIAVLYRTHRQAEVIEHCLRTEGIPCVIVGRDKLLSDPLVCGVTGFFRYLADENNRLALRAFETIVPDKQQLAALTEAFAPKAAKEKPAKLIASLISAAGLENGEAAQALLGLASSYERMDALLSALLLGEEADVLRESGKAMQAGAVKLMTLHGAKGLEFPVVFLAGMTQGTLPLDMPGRTGDVAEERRLFFVGLTRAKEELILLSSGEASPFLRELPQDELQRETIAQKRSAQVKQLSFF